MTEVNIDEFYELSVQPDFPDEMAFRINAVNPDNPGTFSREGVEGIVDQMDAYIMARTFGHWGKTGQPPKELTIHLKLEWEDIEPSDIPWYRYAMDKGDVSMTSIDGKLRIPRSRYRK